MTCNRCGAPCQGHMCSACSAEQYQESLGFEYAVDAEEETGKETEEDDDDE